MEGLHPSYLVGIDWASDKHDVCVLDLTGTIVDTFLIPHTADGLLDRERRLRRFDAPQALPLAIERPSGLLVDTLVETGFPVVPIHPNALKATRPRYVAAPTPESAARLGPERLERFLKRASCCGRRPDQLLERLCSAPIGRAAELESETKGHLVRSLVAVLRPLVAQIRELDGLIAAHLAQHPDGETIQSFPRTGTVNAAQILAELGDDRLRFATEAQLAAEAGVAPVTHSSGTHRGVACRFACHKRLRKALTTRADNSRHAHPRARHVYREARRRGCDPPHATRILARAWVRGLWRCWQNGTSYDPSKHGSAIPFPEPAEPSSAAA